MLGQQPAGDVGAESVSRPERFQPGAPLGDPLAAPGDIDEQCHRRKPRLGDAGDPHYEPVGDLLRVIPVAVGVVRKIVGVLQIKAVGRQPEASRLRQQQALVRCLARVGEVAALQVRPGQLERGPQLDAEHPGIERLPVRHGEEADRLLDLARALIEQPERHQRVRLDPRRHRDPGRFPRLLGLRQRGGLVLGVDQRLGVGRQRAGSLPARRIRRQHVDCGLGSLGSRDGLVGLQQQVREPLAHPVDEHGIGRGVQVAAQPAQLVHGPDNVAACGSVLR